MRDKIVIPNPGADASPARHNPLARSFAIGAAKPMTNDLDPALLERAVDVLTDHFVDHKGWFTGKLAEAITRFAQREVEAATADLHDELREAIRMRNEAQEETKRVRYHHAFPSPAALRGEHK